MRILEVTPYFAPAWAYGGPPRSVYELSRELVRRGHSVTVLTTDAHDATSRADLAKEDIEGIQVRRFRNVSNYLAWHQQLFLPTETGEFLREHLQDFDIVHLHMFRTFQNVAVHRVATRKNVPYVMSAHGSLPRIVHRRAAKAIFDGLVGVRLLRDAKRLVALSNAEKSQYESVGVPPSKISIVFNGIDSGIYRDLPPRGSFAQKYGLEGKRLITYIGRLNARKGLDHLLRAFRHLPVAEDSIALVLVGPDDGYRAPLERLARRLSLQDRVVFTGLVTFLEKLNVLVDSDLIVYPASHEIFGLVPLEALLCGIPVVVSNDSGCGEIVGGARAGFTIPFGDVESLKNAIVRGLENGPEVREMVEHGQRFISDRLRWDLVAAEIEAVYIDATTSGAAGASPAS